MKHKRRLASLLILIMIFSSTLTSIADVEGAKERADAAEVVTEAAVAAAGLYDAEIPEVMEVEEVTEEEETSRKAETETAMVRLKTATPSTPSEPLDGAANGEGWYLDEYGCLHITGPVSYDGMYNVPWKNVKDQIIVVVAEGEDASINDGICLFDGCNNLEYVDLEKLDTSKVKSMNSMFLGCKRLTDIDWGSIDTSQVESFFRMFDGCESLTSLDLSGFKTSNVTNMRWMFERCSSLKTLNLSGFDTHSLVDMGYMFHNCSQLTTLNLGSFDTTNVIYMEYLFDGMSSLESLDLRKFSTAKVTTMRSMFRGASKLQSLDLSSFNTINVTLMDDMFNQCYALNKIFVSELFTTEKVNDSDGIDMFAGCENLEGGAGTKFNIKHIDKEYARIDGKDGNPGYFTGKDTTFTVRFLDENGEPLSEPQEVRKGSLADLPTPPKKEGYYFLGWHKEGSEEEWWQPNDPIEEDTTLIARWTREYTVIFDSCGGSPVETQHINEGHIIGTSLKDPTKEGYAFRGWSRNTGYFYAWDLEKDPVMSDMTLYAWWDDTYTVSFDMGGGSPSVPSQEVAPGGLVEDPGIPMRAGYAFEGWYTSEYYYTEWDFDNDTVYRDMTLFAKWSQDEFTVTFDTGAGSKIDPVQVHRGETIEKPVDPAREGYVFGGWYTSSSYYREWDFSYDKVTEDMTLYARWDEKYTVTFDSAGGSAVESQEVEPGGKVTRPGDPARDEYAFDGWYTSEYYYTEWDFDNDTVNRNMTLFAKWSRDGYTVAFDTAGGTEISSVKVKPGAKLGKPADPTKEGYVFGGWYTNLSYYREWDFDWDTVTEDMTLYARWDEKYTVTFDSAGGSGVPSQQVAPGGKVTKPADPARTGKAFAGWYTSEYYYTEWDFDNDTVNRDMTLFAQWGDVCTVTFDSAGGSEVPSQQVAPGGKVTKPATPTRSGYTFVNWVRINSQSEAVWNFDTDTVTESITLTARWKESGGTEYTVTFDTGGGSSVPSQKVAFNGKATKPANPTRSGYTFAGWYSDPTFAAQYNFDMPIDRDLTIYAKWTKGGNGGGGGGGGVAAPNGPGCIGSWNNPVKNGTWSLDGYGYWHYQTTQPFRYTWAYIYDPNAAEGQPAVNCFFFDTSGYMVIGWQHIVDKWYYFNPGPEGVIGALFLGEGMTPEGFLMDTNGAWTGR